MPALRLSIPSVAASLLAAGLTFAGLGSLVAAPDARPALFIITDQEGYGTGECLDRQGGCGRIIAESFCEAKGFKSADFYRRATIDDITGSLPADRRPAPRAPLAFVIACK